MEDYNHCLGRSHNTIVELSLVDLLDVCSILLGKLEQLLRLTSTLNKQLFLLQVIVDLQ